MNYFYSAIDVLIFVLEFIDSQTLPIKVLLCFVLVLSISGSIYLIIRNWRSILIWIALIIVVFGYAILFYWADYLCEVYSGELVSFLGLVAGLALAFVIASLWN